MLRIGVQTKNVVYDENPAEGFEMLRRAGFSCADFSLNSYLMNKSLYNGELNSFFDQSEAELANFFAPHKEAAKAAERKLFCDDIVFSRDNEGRCVWVYCEDWVY